MTTFLYWVPTWAFIFIQSFVTFEQGVHHDRHRQAEEACAHTEDTAGVTPAIVPWPSQDAHGRPRTGPGTIAENLPILAHRLAHVDFVQQGIAWRPLTRPQHFGVEADAECRTNDWQDHHHPVPTWGCTCGFYAVPADIELQPSGFYVDLEVMLTGDVIIHDKGYRAAHQTVLAMTVPRCFCGVPAQYVAITRSGALQSWGCVPQHVVGQQANTLQATTAQAMVIMRSGGEVMSYVESFHWGIVSIETLGHYCPVPVRNH